MTDADKIELILEAIKSLHEHQEILIKERPEQLNAIMVARVNGLHSLSKELTEPKFIPLTTFIRPKNRPKLRLV